MQSDTRDLLIAGAVATAIVAYGAIHPSWFGDGSQRRAGGGAAGDRRPRVDPLVPTQAIDHHLGRVHVGTADSQVRADIEQALAAQKDPRWTAGLRRQAVAYALWRHHRNLRDYQAVMGGGRRASGGATPRLHEVANPAAVGWEWRQDGTEHQLLWIRGAWTLKYGVRGRDGRWVLTDVRNDRFRILRPDLKAARAAAHMFVEAGEELP